MIYVKNFENGLLVNRNNILKLINEFDNKNDSLYISLVDIVVLNNALNNSDYNELLNSLDALICDSSFLVFIYNLKRRKNLIGLNASELFTHYIENSNFKQLIIGSTKTEFELIKEKSVNRKLSYLDIGFSDKYTGFDYNLIEKTVKENNIHILWVMLGNPKQDYVIKHLKSRGNINCVVISSGAAYLFYLKIINTNYFSFIGLKTHWINRIIQNPKRQLKRIYDVFLYIPKIIFAIK